jgi:dihydrofolate synthase/folylpolyglutamate synthase
MRLTMDISKNNKLFIKNLNSELLGLYESKNIVTVLQTIELLNKIGYNISKTDILKGVDTVFEQTVLMGRWQIMSKSPLTICDVAHNEDGIKQIVKQLSVTKYENLHFVFGMVKDKDIAQILKLLPQKATYYFCKANIPRALDQNKLLKKAKENNLTGIAYPSVENAFLSAKSNAKKNDLVFVSGSTFIVAEVIPLYS